MAIDEEPLGKPVDAGATAGLVSGAPSTLDALLTGRPPLEATLAAGFVLLPGEERRLRRALAAVPLHLGLSFAWAVAPFTRRGSPSRARGAEVDARPHEAD